MSKVSRGGFNVRADMLSRIRKSGRALPTQVGYQGVEITL